MTTNLVPVTQHPCYHRPSAKQHPRGQKPPLKPKEVWAIRIRLQIEKKDRELALFNLAIDSKLRSCDLVALKVEDVAPSGTPRERAVITQRKTGRPVHFELTEQTREAISRWMGKRDLRDGDPLFPSRNRE
jgi:integrase